VIARAVGERYTALVYTAAFAGLRAGELAGLERRQAELLHRTITVEHRPRPWSARAWSSAPRNHTPAAGPWPHRPSWAGFWSTTWPPSSDRTPPPDAHRREWRPHPHPALIEEIPRRRRPRRRPRAALPRPPPPRRHPRRRHRRLHPGTHGPPRALHAPRPPHLPARDRTAGPPDRRRDRRPPRRHQQRTGRSRRRLGGERKSFAHESRTRPSRQSKSAPHGRHFVASDQDFYRERATGIEPAFSAWEADVLPLNYARMYCLGPSL
jgi:hypothetical protein